MKMDFPLLKGKRGLVVGIANHDSIATGCARAFKAAGAELALTYLNDKARPYVQPVADELKGIVSDVDGHADILVAPDLEAANMMAKQLIYLAGAEAAGVVLIARVPIILTSRADTVLARMVSCAMVQIQTHHLQQQST